MTKALDRIATGKLIERTQEDTYMHTTEAEFSAGKTAYGVRFGDDFVDELMNEIDFGSIRLYMQKVRWGWSDCEGNLRVPTIERMRKEVRRLIGYLKEVNYTDSSTGGFYVQAVKQDGVESIVVSFDKKSGGGYYYIMSKAVS